MLFYPYSNRLQLPIGVLSAVLLLAGCSKPAPPEEPVRAVRLITVGEASFDATYEFAAEVRARSESRLGFRVAGKMIRRQAELGQRVKAGQVLAQLDSQDYKLAADAAQAQVAAAVSSRDLAAADFKRFKELKEQNFISGAELERREATLKAAQAGLQQAQAQLSSQGNQARYTNLVADVSGVVTAVEAEPGQVVTAGAPVVRIAQDGARDVVFAVPEDKVRAILVDSQVAVRVWADGPASKAVLTGKVREVAASADPVTRTFPIKVALSTATDLPLGSTVYVMPQGLGLAGAQVIKLPTTALRQKGGDTTVWVLDKASMTLKAQPVVVATADGNQVVIASGLLPGMQVVSAGVHVLQPGQKVSIYQEKKVLPQVDTAQAAINNVANTTAPATK
jgi:membrane fusion protein, multidrug efflux system